MLTHLDSVPIRAPFARYSHGVVVAAGARLLFCSGQLGVSPEDHVPDEAEAQADLCFANIDALLSEAGMGRQDLVRLNAYVTGRAHMAAYMAARDRFVAELTNPPASTLMIVSGFTREVFKVEVEAIAASGQTRQSR